MQPGNFYQDEIWQGNYSAGISAFYARKLDAFDMSLHKHPRVEIMYIAHGQAHLFVEDTPRHVTKPADQVSTYVLRRNDLIFLNGGVSHRLNITENCQIYNIEFDFHINKSQKQDSLQGLFYESRELCRFIKQHKEYVVIKDAAGRIENLFGFLMHELAPYKNKSIEMGPAIKHDIIDHILKIIILLVARGGMQQQTDPDELYVRKALEIIDHRYDSDISISLISAELGISQAYLHRLCQKYMHTTPYVYLIRLRIEKALEYLENTDKPIADIAFSCGFNSRQSFYKIFHKYMGCSAREYRNSYFARQEALIGG